MTETPTITLTSFLLARIAEDEANGPRVGCSDHSPLMLCNECPPAPRVLADCDAKRRIIKNHETQLRYREYGTEPMIEGAIGAYEDTLRLLALPYADHPEFREEWRV